tara:strand:- start:361 stop:606 length:246 start_codon:yes stop_codon:yes gene_type:complete
VYDKDVNYLVPLLAELLVVESEHLATKCNFPPHLVAAALIFAAVKKTTELADPDLKDLFETAVEEAFGFYDKVQETSKQLH